MTKPPCLFQLEVYLGNDPASTVCSRSAVYSTDFSTCADLYLLRDTWENLKKCGWDTREDAANLVLNNTIHVRVYDNVKNPLGGYYVSICWKWRETGRGGGYCVP